MIEQLAGDLIENRTEESIIATGYLVLGAKVLAEPDREKLLMDTIDEQIDSTGKAFLGMTFGCVRCHDHKFDPIKQTDYYALAAIFKGTLSFATTKTGAIQHWNETPLTSTYAEGFFKELDQQIKEKASKASQFKNEAITKIRNAARESAAKYLAAASLLTTDVTLAELQPIADRYGLHPRILFHCRKHLEMHQEDPFFGQWHAFKAQNKTPDEFVEYFQGLFDKVKHQALLRENKSNVPDAGQTLSQEEMESIRHAESAIQIRLAFLQSRPNPNLLWMIPPSPSMTG